MFGSQIQVKYMQIQGKYKANTGPDSKIWADLYSALVSFENVWKPGINGEGRMLPV